MLRAKNSPALRTTRRKVVATTTQKAVPALARDGINPETGRPWSLADPQVQAELDQEFAAMRRDPKLAEEFLKDLGILTSGGRLSSKYGGRR